MAASLLLETLKAQGAILSVTLPDGGSNPVAVTVSVGQSSVAGGGNGLFITKSATSSDSDANAERVAEINTDEEVCVALVPDSLILSTDSVIEVTNNIDGAVSQFGTTGSKLGFQFGAFLEKFAEDEEAPALSERTIVMLFLLFLKVVNTVESSSPNLETETDKAILTILAPFKAYFAALPSAAEFDVPITWPASSLKRRLLKGTDLYAGAEAKLKTLQREWNTIGQKFKEACESEIGTDAVAKINIESWVWADCVWWSRVIEIPSSTEEEHENCDDHAHDHGAGSSADHSHSHSHSHAANDHSHSHENDDDYETDDEDDDDDDDDELNALIPIIDFINHKSEHNARWEPTPDGVAIVVNREWLSGLSVGQSEEIFITYGERTNDRLLFVHGFTRSETTHYPFTFPIPGLSQVVESLGNDPTAVEEDEQLDEEAMKKLTVKQEVAIMWTHSPSVKLSVLKEATEGPVSAAAPASVMSEAIKDALDPESLTAIYVSALDDADVALELPEGWGDGHSHTHAEGEQDHDHDHDTIELPKVVLFGNTEDSVKLPLNVGPAVLTYLAETALAGPLKKKLITNARSLVRDAAKSVVGGLEESYKEIESEVSAVLAKPATDPVRIKVEDILRLRGEQEKAAKWVIARLDAADE
ncbi:SET domain-containing protein [Gonapodya prolifera JEL478]|uniref:SET domain-containing protein n=1 Tax=Gonapodya prolifera (strain JEL478) TaxID=1344416 RepID=A0A139B103_GONPJ|nr:SET domain-containing protein [Gonapodya prolifera JEL478]|eukprot:KXS22483.1 SET domain-containing protein [Gonapodya prolifera JEL478]